MNLIDRYVEKIGEHLPEKTRVDIQAEIRSLIEDALEDRSHSEDRAPDEAMILEVLKEYGEPGKVAASYLPPRYLIGPRLFPLFSMVIKIALLIVLIVGLVQLGVSISQSNILPTETGKLVLQAFLNLLSSGVQIFGNIVIIFAAVEWALSKSKEETTGWDPQSLKHEDDPELVRAGDQIAGIIFTLIALVAINFLPQLGQLISLTIPPQTTIIIPDLTSAFYRWLPWIDLVWALSILLDALLLWRGKWENTTRWLSVGISVANLVVLFAMWSGPELVTLDASVVEAAKLQMLANMGLRTMLGIIFIAEGFSLGKRLYRQIMKRPLKLPV